MGVIQKMLAMLVRDYDVRTEGGPATEAEEAAWEAYSSAWELDPPPSPRAVFLAGYRASRGQDGLSG